MAWYNSGQDRWRYRLALTTDKTQVGADDTNFPVPVKVTTTECTALAAAQAGGGDFLFTNSDGTTKLDHEIVSWDGATLIAWVELDAVDKDNDQTFYLYWGCSTCVSQEARTGTWPSTYKFSLHMNDGAVQTESAATTLWLMKPRAVYHSGTYQRTYFVYLKYGSADIYATYFDHDTLRWATPVKVDDSEVDNGHCAPSIAIDSSGYLYVFHGGYSGATGKLWLRKSTNVESIAAWDAAVAVVNSDVDATYPHCHVMPSGTLVLFHRGKRTDGADFYHGIYRVRSTDGGATWGNSQTVMEGTATQDLPYFDTFLQGSRLHLAYHYMDYSESSLHHDLYYAYSDDAGDATPTWKSADGASLSLPLAETAGALVYNTEASWGTGYLMGITATSGNVPLILYKSQIASPSNAAVQCHRYVSGAWSTATVLESASIGTPVDANAEIGDGSITVIGESICAAFTVSVSSKDEVQEYISTDGGATWAKARDITTGSSTHNSCPYYPVNGNGACRLIWVLGADGYNRVADIRYFGDIARQARTTSTSYVNDSTANAHSGTKKGAAEPASATGILGAAQDFDGSDDYISMGDHDDFSFGNGSTNSPFTVSLWAFFATDSLAGNSYGLLSKWIAASTEWMIFTSSSGYIYFRAYDESTSGYIGRYYGTALPENEWVHLVCTYGGGTTSASCKIYLNGTQVDNADSASGTYVALENLAVDLEIGRYDANSIRVPDGMLDEVQLIAAEKASTWVTTAYNSQAKPLVGESGGFWKAYVMEANNTPQAAFC